MLYLFKVRACVRTLILLPGGRVGDWILERYKKY